MTAIRYAVFALLAVIVNLSVQSMSFQVYRSAGALYMALVAGTVAGLAVKYLFDKVYIFNDRFVSPRRDARQLMRYSMTGVLTTAIFWVFEISADAIFEVSSAKYIGGFIGLVIGYTAKFHLDKRFVFRASVP